MRLLEVIPTPETDPAVIASLADFADRRLGKKVVYAHEPLTLSPTASAFSS